MRYNNIMIENAIRIKLFFVLSLILVVTQIFKSQSPQTVNSKTFKKSNTGKEYLCFKWK